MGAIGFSADAASNIIDTNPAAISQYITDSMQNKAWIIYYFLPGLCMIVSCIPMLFYKIDKKTKEQMRVELAARHAAQDDAIANECGVDDTQAVFDCDSEDCEHRACDINESADDCTDTQKEDAE